MVNFKLYFIVFIFINLYIIDLTKAESHINNPFCYHDDFQCKAIGLCNISCSKEQDKACFALITVNNKKYKVRSGDIICNYKVIDINTTQVKLKNINSNINKSLQLKEAEGLGG